MNEEIQANLQIIQGVLSPSISSESSEVQGEETGSHKPSSEEVATLKDETESLSTSSFNTAQSHHQCSPRKMTLIQLGRTDYREELKQLKLLKNSCNEEDKKIVGSMVSSTEITRSMDPEERKRLPKPKKTTNLVVPSIPHISHKMGKRRQKVRASVRMGMTLDEFSQLDKVYLRTFQGEFGPAEYVIDRQTEKCQKHQHAHAVEMNGTRRVLLRQLYPYVRNVRTQTNEVIAKRKQIYEPLFILTPFKTCYKSFLHRALDSK